MPYRISRDRIIFSLARREPLRYSAPERQWMSATGSYDRGLWPNRYTAHERTTLKVQSRHDRRNIALVWFWRYLTDEDDGGAAPDDTYYEEPAVNRRYDGPHGVHLVVDDTAKSKGLKRGVVTTEGQVSIFMSRAECIRLGVLFDKRDDRDVTLGEEALAEDGPFALGGPLYIPRAGDVFLFRKKHHRIAQFEPDYEQSLNPNGVVMAWKGTAELLSMDATSPETQKAQLVPPTSDPIVSHGEGRDVLWLG